MELVHNSESGLESDDSLVSVQCDLLSRIQKNYPTSQVISDVIDIIRTRRKEMINYRDMTKLSCFSSVCSMVRTSCFALFVEPKIMNKGLKDEFWINAMHKELNQFVRNNVFLRPEHVNIIGKK